MTIRITDIRFIKYTIGIFLIMNVLFFVAPKCAAGWLIYHKPVFGGKILDAATNKPIEGALVIAVYKAKQVIGIIPYHNAPRYTVKIKEALTDGNGDYYFPPYTKLIAPSSVEDYVDFRIFKPGYKKEPFFNIWALPDGLAFSVKNLTPTLLKRIDENRKQSFEEYMIAHPDKDRLRTQLFPTKDYIEFYLPILPLEDAVQKLERLDIPFLSLPDDIDLHNIKWIEKSKEISSYGINESSQFTVYGLTKAITRAERLASLPHLEDTDEYDFLDNLTIFARLLNEEEARLGLQKSDLYKAREATRESEKRGRK